MPKGLWLEELLKALWALRTSPTRAMGFSPFKLLFRDEAMTTGKLATKSLRATTDQEPTDREISLDILEENHVQAITTMAGYAAMSLRHTIRRSGSAH